MRFAYREYVSVFSGTDDYRLILRPVITLRIIGPKSAARWDALVDSGADETLFPLSLAEVLGVELDQELTSQAAGISGDRLEVQYGVLCVTRKWHFPWEGISYAFAAGRLHSRTSLAPGYTTPAPFHLIR